MKYRAFLATPLGLIPAAAADTANAAPPTPVFNWTGFYVGANLGFDVSQSKQTDFVPNSGTFNYGWTALGFGQTQTATGVLGGLQIGYNFQNGMWLYGFEADIDIGSSKKTTHGGVPAFGYGYTNVTGLESLGTVRGRLGYAFTPNTMAYLTGGLAVGKMRDAFKGGAAYSWSRTDWRTGVALGGGLEYALSKNVSIKGEGLFYDLGSEKHVSSDGVSAQGLKDHMMGFVARIGINYLFH